MAWTDELPADVAAALRAANELGKMVALVSTAHDERTLLVGGWQEAALALPDQLARAQTAIAPVANELAAATTGTFLCGNVAARTAHEALCDYARLWLPVLAAWNTGDPSHRGPHELSNAFRRNFPKALGEAQVPTPNWEHVRATIEREAFDAARLRESKTPGDGTADARRAVKSKRSTERGEGRAKLIAALTKHHKYDDGGCLNLEPIGNNELARLAGVDQATASAFFKQQFKGHGKYKTACADAARLAAALKLLNGEFAPHLLYGGKPANEDERDEE